MLKKTGIVAAAIAASLLAVTPLAFAGGKDPADSHSKKKDSDDDDKAKADDDDSDDDDDDADDSDDDDDDDNDDDDDDDDDDDSDDDDSDDVDAPATVNKDNNSTDCTNVQATGDTNGTLTGGNAGLLGVVNLAANLVAPIAAQAPLLNCNNLELEDTVDVLTINPSNDSAAIDG